MTNEVTNEAEPTKTKTKEAFVGIDYEGDGWYLLSVEVYGGGEPPVTEKFEVSDYELAQLSLFLKGNNVTSITCSSDLDRPESPYKEFSEMLAKAW